jgi:hypothetical protein
MGSFLVVLLAASPIASPWQFHDAVAHEGRSLLAYRRVELDEQPPRPLPTDDQPPGKALYGLLHVGDAPEASLAIVWLPEAQQVWLDADGDGRFAPREHHRLGSEALDVSAFVILQRPGHEPRKVQRTVMLRRTGDGGLRYAVRGYVSGTLHLGAQTCAVLLADGNADGCFDSPGADRIWIDLDRDGRFDPLTEQFPLGQPLSVDGKTYLFKPAVDGSDVQVRERPAETGTLRLTLLDGSTRDVADFTAELVSDWGELVALRRLGQAESLPVGRYVVESLAFQLTDRAGRKWQYRFGGTRRFAIEISPGRETSIPLLQRLALSLTVDGGTKGVRPRQDIDVTPNLQTAGGLYLADCRACARNSDVYTPTNADIRLLGPEAASLDHASSGFL